ncbi:AraC family transcriptional activator of pobA [Parabacteroides sp. PFB2-10]|uniref:helix-turn-helix domain-containing protein n=1 Tax=Parabacteroides sp. PFB2-10 TaxID=1742405 RepID=UPI00247546DB|nr:helix-turn-helix domain-containing protein [Parabacteroides sp. PFB2-10]MDH6313780.1 AraC family transcriptional activator of pobA [Parabacteroides sp. PFB2-10]MDL2245005.1 helix-turn-helix domain-containing protein [Parabacteroides sp. OttesenSCG-928-J18]
MEWNNMEEIRDLDRFNGLFTLYDNVLGLASLDASSINGQTEEATYRFPFDSDKRMMLWVLTGECSIRMEGIHYSLDSKDFLLMLSGNSFRFLSVSPDFKAQMIIAEKNYLDECISNKQILSFFYQLLIKRALQISLTTEDITLLEMDFINLKKKIESPNHSYYKEQVSVSFFSLLLDLFHSLDNRSKNSFLHPSTRKEEIFNKFLNLLMENYKEQHEVAFYANRLFITSQYLTLIIKELTGKTVNRWIDENLILEARKLLKTTGATVQQIADELNFSDQSTFGKFFKKHHGISPIEYRRTQARVV